MREQGIIDPTKVVRTALIDASSVASLMLTTECMIYDEPEKKENKWSTKRWIWIWMIWITCIYWNNVYEANDKSKYNAGYINFSMQWHIFTITKKAGHYLIQL